MNDNFQKSKALLEQAMKLLPRDFALSSVRAYLTRTINECAVVEKKQQKREAAKNTPTQALPPIMTAEQQKNALDALEKLIGDEEKKLQSILERKKKGGGSQNLFG